MSVFFISDPHFHHKNMAIKRGFSCEEEMNEQIVYNWNEVISKRDMVYILGDITMEKNKYSILDRLKGDKIVILGNHDKFQHVPDLLKYVTKVGGMLNYKGQYLLTHCPVHPNELDYRFSYNIHGHVHENTLNDPRYINVSCEAVNYKPIEFSQLHFIHQL